MGALKPEDVKKILENTRWDYHDALVKWDHARPSCSTTHNSALCGEWQGWIIAGRLLYPDTKKGEKAYIEHVRNQAPQVKREDILATLALDRQNKYLPLFRNMQSNAYGSSQSPCVLPRLEPRGFSGTLGYSRIPRPEGRDLSESSTS